ncbi:YgfZ/GcvT domain-containing protein [Brevundimonas sp.]|uniref:CAF17-like 4Fe-4S cluster assembly/insertion protein YgfZ n=1 Tax=Brevundimonas sp. TaxID=1871086 RepID=UPI003AF8921A
MSARIASLPDRALVRVGGPDARTFLNGLLTQEVLTLEPGQLRFGALLSPPGRLLFDLFLFGENDGVLLDVDADRRDALIQRLSLYRLRAQVTITPDDGTVQVLWPAGPDTPGRPDPRLAALGHRHYGASLPTTAEAANWHDHRLTLGIPDPARDGGQDTTYPIEADFDLLNGIDFSKGCFIGQETTSRMKRRGAIRNRMLTLEVDGPLPSPGTEVLNGERRAGQTLSGQGNRLMALLRLDRLDGQLTVDGSPARVLSPDWMPRN